MQIRSKKTGIEHFISVELWKKMGEIDPGSHRRYVVLDHSELELKERKINIKSLSNQKVLEIEPEVKPIGEVFETDEFDSSKYSIPEIEEFMWDKEWDDYTDKFINDKRKGVLKHLKIEENE